MTVNQTVQQGQLLTDLDDASHPGVICPIDGTITNLTPIDSDLAGTRPIKQSRHVEVTIKPQNEQVDTAWNTPPVQGRTLGDWLKITTPYRRVVVA